MPEFFFIKVNCFKKKVTEQEQHQFTSAIRLRNKVVKFPDAQHYTPNARHISHFIHHKQTHTQLTQN